MKLKDYGVYYQALAEKRNIIEEQSKENLSLERELYFENRLNEIDVAVQEFEQKMKKGN